MNLKKLLIKKIKFFFQLNNLKNNYLINKN